MGSEVNETELSVEQAAELLSVHKNTIRRYIHEGRLPAMVYHPRRFRVKEDDVLAIKQANTIGKKYAPRTTN